MKFEEALAALDADKSNTCAAGKWFASLDDDTRASVENALDNVPIYRVWRAAQVMGLKASNSTFDRHVQKICRCHK